MDRDELMIFIQPSIVNSAGSLDYVQADMDSRYNVSEQSRTFADGAVLPPLDPIIGKGSAAAAPVAVPVEPKEDGRRSMGPIHRR